jgi:hypothetical protein
MKQNENLEEATKLAEKESIKTKEVPKKEDPPPPHEEYFNDESTQDSTIIDQSAVNPEE